MILESRFQFSPGTYSRPAEIKHTDLCVEVRADRFVSELITSNNYISKVNREPRVFMLKDGPREFAPRHVLYEGTQSTQTSPEMHMVWHRFALSMRENDPFPPVYEEGSLP